MNFVAHTEKTDLFDSDISVERSVICDLWVNIGATETVHFLRNVLSELEKLPSILAAASADPSRNTEAVHKMAGKLATSGILTRKREDHLWRN